MAPEKRYDRLLMAASLLSDDMAAPIEGMAQNGPRIKAINYRVPTFQGGYWSDAPLYGNNPIFGVVKQHQYAGDQYHQSVYGFPTLEDPLLFRGQYSGMYGAAAKESKKFLAAEFHRNFARRSFGEQVVGESLDERLSSATSAVERAAKALQEALDIKRTLLELSQAQAMRQAHTELYGPDSATGRTAAQEYLAFKQTQREQRTG